MRWGSPETRTAREPLCFVFPSQTAQHVGHRWPLGWIILCQGCAKAVQLLAPVNVSQSAQRACRVPPVHIRRGFQTSQDAAVRPKVDTLLQVVAKSFVLVDVQATDKHMARNAYDPAWIPVDDGLQTRCRLMRVCCAPVKLCMIDLDTGMSFDPPTHRNASKPISQSPPSSWGSSSTPTERSG